VASAFGERRRSLHRSAARPRLGGRQTARVNAYPCTTVSVREWIARRSGPGGTTFAVLRQSDGALVGCAGFGDDTRAAELGYWIGRPSWGLGFATESVRAVVGHARERGVEALMSHVFLDNPASARVLEKVRFTYRGVTTGHDPLRGGVRKAWEYRLGLSGASRPRAARATTGGQRR
jgi:RimJ/RimL family protein N-acetyltransferase